MELYSHCDFDSESARSVLAPGKAWESSVPVDEWGRAVPGLCEVRIAHISMVLARALYLRDQEVESDFWWFMAVASPNTT